VRARDETDKQKSTTTTLFEQIRELKYCYRSDYRVSLRRRRRHRRHSFSYACDSYSWRSIRHSSWSNSLLCR
jgi:hypothetical protein